MDVAIFGAATQLHAVDRRVDLRDLYWFVGLLEGEGTFLKGPPSGPRCAIVRLAMTDEDVVVRAATLLDRAVVPWQRRSAKPLKCVYMTSIKGTAAVRIMAMIRPLIGERRRRQVDKAVAAPRARSRTTVREARCVVPLCLHRVRARGLCRTHYGSWWKTTRRGRSSIYQPAELLPPVASVVDPLRVPSPTDELALHWLAGLLEGEGTFADARGYPELSVTMCDRDVLERAASILGIVTVLPRSIEQVATRGWSPQFKIGLCGSRAATWMRTLRPLMGERRRGQIDRALAGYHPIRLTKAPAHCVVNGCWRSHRGRGLCHRHYMQWHRDRKAGRPSHVTPLR